ncbi:AT-rich interactive domain-containing protein 3B-like isoform X2 [Alosa sapidissima]|uniref:AT-rich interactive domain-containing protein 3B-like isoform X2 n=1 Tax=Alosa sapidissima TaxID=34773 RepID=UPI001C091B11|nr:AT-rich interactive domain-containing protein 3B-like isoform X2 [Alosa sapidissima]
MVDNSGSSKAQMPSMSQEGGLGTGVKLEAVMEQLQRQQQARLEMERKERHLREAHIMYAQQMAAQQAILAAARAQGAGFMGKGLGPAGMAALAMAGGAGGGGGGVLSRASNQNSVDSEREDDDEDGARGRRDSGEDDEEEDEEEEEMMEGDEGTEGEDEDERGGVAGPGGVGLSTADAAAGLEYLRKQTLALQQGIPCVPPRPYGNYVTAAPGPGPQRAPSPPVRVKQEPEESLSPAEPHSAASPNGQADWSYDDHFKQNGSAAWVDDTDSPKGRGEASRDFTKLYELDSDPQRKEFLDDLFSFMQKRGTPVNRIPIMAKQVLDLYKLYKLVTEKGGLVEVINKKIWREITKGLNLPTSITSAAFTLRTQYMKYLYPFECERKGLSSPSELQAAIDSNRREGRRPSYSSSVFRFSPSPSAAPHILSSPKMHMGALGAGAAGALNGMQASSSPSLKKGVGLYWHDYKDMASSMLAGRSQLALSVGQQQVAGLARATTLEQLREKLETGGMAAGLGGMAGFGAAAAAAAAAGLTEGPERKMARLAEEQQRLLQQAFHHNLLAMASQVPMNLRLGNVRAEDKQDLSLSISTSGASSISVSVEVNGTLYSGTLFAQKSAAPAASVAPTVTSAGPSGIYTFPSSHSPSSSASSKGPSSAEPSCSGSP